ncbi:MAG: aminoacetone oxidase family FAD-binding enzyme [Lachnospiraceae bacterium]|nr:aminoacetone oxidase family FAD-binding enzyme [Lachnospiraceae bacterium]
MYDLCIIGGGASGLSCAIQAGRLGLKVLLIDKNNKLGKKLYATGNGKCNLTNSNISYEKHYYSSSNNSCIFLTKALENAYNPKEPNQQIIDFVDSLGINTFEDNNYIYPSSAQASSVVWAMLDELKHYNVDILSNTEITSIEGKYPFFIIKAENKAYKASQMVLSCGGAAYKSLGGTYSGYNLAKSMGHNVVSVRPALCGLCVIEDVTDIAGVRANANICLLNNNEIICSSKGELQLTKQGLSGICIFEISSWAGKLINQGITPQVNVSFIDDDTYNQLIDKIKSNNISHRTIIGFLNGYVNDKLAQYVCSINNVDGKKKAMEISQEVLISLISSLHGMMFNVSELYDMEQAQVTAGGVNIDEINPITMESKLVNGLYITGELLDIDGICGGYNLTFAMLTGIKAGKSIYDKIKSN